MKGDATRMIGAVQGMSPPTKLAMSVCFSEESRLRAAICAWYSSGVTAWTGSNLALQCRHLSAAARISFPQAGQLLVSRPHTVGIATGADSFAGASGTSEHP